jgi:hypothetical protein
MLAPAAALTNSGTAPRAARQMLSSTLGLEWLVSLIRGDVSGTGPTWISDHALVHHRHYPGALQLIQPNKPSTVPFAALECARCPQCYAKMTLARIMAGSPGFEIRSYECPECEHATVARVSIDLWAAPSVTSAPKSLWKHRK